MTLRVCSILAVFEVQTMRFGVVTLKAVHSGMFLSIDDNGRVHGKVDFNDSVLKCKHTIKLQTLWAGRANSMIKLTMQKLLLPVEKVYVIP